MKKLTTLTVILSLFCIFVGLANADNKAMPWIPLLLFDDWAPPQLISPANGSYFYTCGGSTSAAVTFSWKPVSGATRYFYKVWSNYPNDEYEDSISNTEVTLSLWYIHESGNYSAEWYWQVKVGDGSSTTPFSEVRRVNIAFGADPCE